VPKGVPLAGRRRQRIQLLPCPGCGRQTKARQSGGRLCERCRKERKALQTRRRELDPAPSTEPLPVPAAFSRFSVVPVTGEEIRAARHILAGRFHRVRPISQSKMAQLMGVTLKTLWRYEQGQRPAPVAWRHALAWLMEHLPEEEALELPPLPPERIRDPVEIGEWELTLVDLER
jgi:hypothetical protein